jgi:hypothetical protein
MLVRVADRLFAELGDVDFGEFPGAGSILSEKGVMVGILSSEDELAVTTLRGRLAKIAAALADTAKPANQRAVLAALDGAEMVMRGELVNGNGSGLPRLMPSFIFLVALPIVGQDRALELSRRSAELIEQELGE